MEIYRMLLGIIGIASSFGLIVVAERCRKNPEPCKDKFMGANGVTRSFVALRYIGEPDLAQEAFVTKPNVRRAWIIERYIWAVISFVAGIFLLGWSFF